MVPGPGYGAPGIALKLFNRLLSGFSISFVYLLYFETRKIIINVFKIIYKKKTTYLFIILYFIAITTV